MNGTNDKKWQIQDCFSREGGECCKGSDQSGAPAPRSALAWRGRCLRVDVSPEELKIAFLKLNSRDLVHTFWQHFTKKSFKINNWIHYHVWRSSHFSCFDAFVSTFICENLKSGCLRGSSLSEASEGEFPLQKLKKLQFSNSIRCIPFANILLKTIIHFR